MKENVLDVLMYLFDHYLNEDSYMESDQESLKQELMQVGFPAPTITKAFTWLEGLAMEQGISLASTHGALASPSTRIFTSQEAERLDLDCRGFLLFLEQVGVLDSVTRELVIDRVIALEVEEINLEQLKWVVLMVLFNQPEKEAMFAWMEDFVFDNRGGRLH
jgi:Smg protein